MRSKGPSSLSSNLLARKGQASPSPGGVYANLASSAFRPKQVNGLSRGSDDPFEAQHAKAPQQSAAKRPVGEGARIAMTVRLDHETHRRLKLICAHTKRSSQDIFAAALETYMKGLADSVPGENCVCLAKGGVSGATRG